MPTAPRRPSPEVLELQRRIRGLLAQCEDPAVEGVWLDMIGREEHYLDASLEVDQFAITNGVIVHGPMIEQVLTDNLAFCRVAPQRAGDEPRFAAAIYRAALDDGIMQRVAFN